jgi:hypothetical protein
MPTMMPSGRRIPVSGWPVRGMMAAGTDVPATRTVEADGKADWAALGALAGKGPGCAPPEIVLPRTTLMTGVPYADGGIAPLDDPPAGAALLGGT